MWNIVFGLISFFNFTYQQHSFHPEANIFNHGSRDKKVIALTFDACMTNGMKAELDNGNVPSWYNSEVTEVLKENNIKATFFVSGLWAKSYPEIVKNWSTNPMYEIENHSWDHLAMQTPCYDLPQTKDKSAEIDLTQQILTSLTGTKPHYFRFPGGCYSDDDLKMAAQHGVQPLGWDVISGDSYLKDSKKIESQVLDNAQNGSIIVMHVVGGRTAPSTAKALPNIIKGLKKQGYAFVKVEDMPR